MHHSAHMFMCNCTDNLHGNICKTIHAIAYNNYVQSLYPTHNVAYNKDELNRFEDVHELNKTDAKSATGYLKLAIS